jgi:hypothetical protein
MWAPSHAAQDLRPYAQTEKRSSLRTNFDPQATTPLRLTRGVRTAALAILCALAFAVFPWSPSAAIGPLTVTPVTWDVVGLDSNNVNSGPNAFPVGVRVCNTGDTDATNSVATWSWKTTTTPSTVFQAPAEGSTVSVGTLAAGACRQVIFETTIDRSASSRGKSRDYQITLSADGGVSASGPQRQLYVKKLVSQNRNSAKKLAGAGGCNLAYTVCDPAPANLLVGHTYTYRFYAETSTAYQQIEAFTMFPGSLVQVTSTGSTYSNPAGATSSSLYGDACGWNAASRTCVGPANITGGKAGGRTIVTYVLKAVSPGSAAASTFKPVIYDFSGASYHYNSDYTTFSLMTSSLTVRYELGTTILGSGKVTSSPAGTLTDGSSSGVNCGGAGTTCSVGYDPSTSVTLTAQPLGGDSFVGWSGGGCTGSSLTCTVSMNQSRQVAAQFTGVTSYGLEVAKVGSGTVTADTGAVNCGSTCAGNYASGTLVTLSATPSAGWTFDGFSGEGCSGTGPCTLTMNAARLVTATFSEQTYPLNASVTGNGVVTSSPGTINCGNGAAFCSDFFGSGTIVTLTATPGTGQTFQGWSGACSGSGTTCNVTLDQARSVTAAFTGVAIYPLEVGVAGSGTGSVASDVGGINCGATCTANYNDGTLVTLTATPGSGSTFSGWSGDCSGTGTCTVTMSAARSVTATFGPPQTLTVTKSGAGSGTVTSSPAGIDCGSTCNAAFGEGAIVTLTATAASGSQFSSWSGDCSGSGVTCTVTMSAARSVSASFALTTYPLTVATTGSGSGSLSSSPAGIDCGPTCAADYEEGTSVTLTATPASGSSFAGWSGAGCAGTGTCTVTMSAARSVSAIFLLERALTVKIRGARGGTVTSSVGDIRCRRSCGYLYDDGRLVTLTANPNARYWFVRWSGACHGAKRTCTVTMSRARKVTARFAEKLTLRVSSGVFYHLPHEYATVLAVARWRGRPLAAARLRLRVTCPESHWSRVLRTNHHGRAILTFGAYMPNSLRLYRCVVQGRVWHHGLTASPKRPGVIRFIHPLWLEWRGVEDGVVVVRVWGRAGERVRLYADGDLVARARIHRHGWVDVSLPGVPNGSELWAKGPHGHISALHHSEAGARLDRATQRLVPLDAGDGQRLRSTTKSRSRQDASSC